MPGSETPSWEWQRLSRSPSTHLEAKKLLRVELKVAVALSLTRDGSLSKGGAGGGEGGGGEGDGGGGEGDGGGGLGDGGGGEGDGGGGEGAGGDAGGDGQLPEPQSES